MLCLLIHVLGGVDHLTGEACSTSGFSGCELLSVRNLQLMMPQLLSLELASRLRQKATFQLYTYCVLSTHDLEAFRFDETNVTTCASEKQNLNHDIPHV